MNKKKVLLGLLAVCVLVCFWGVFSVKNYIDKVPKLTVKEIGIVEAGQTLALTDIVDVACKGEYHLELTIDSEIADARVSEDKQSLFVGSDFGTIKVMISGYGGVPEYISEETVIYVGSGAQGNRD